MKDEVEFCLLFFQSDTIILDVFDQASPNYPKWKVKKKVSDADKHESLLQIDTMILMGMFKHC